MNREPHFDENEVLRQCMSPLNEEVPDMPENFHAQWTALVKEDAMKQEETRKVAPMRRWTRILSVAAALVFVVGGTLLTKDSLSPARTSAPQSPAESYDYVYDTYTSDVGYSEEAGSGVRTMMIGAANDAMPEAARTAALATIPAGRMADPDEIARAVEFFAAEGSSYITGQVLCVDGGMAV